MKTKFKYLLQLVLFLLIATNIFGADAPPVTENFEAGVLPHSGWVAWPYIHYYNSPWSFSTNGIGITEIAFDETDNFTNSVPEGMFIYNTANGNNRMRGNYYRCDTTTLLHKQSMTLNRGTNSASIIFAVYESSSSNGTYTLISDNTVNVGTGNTVVTSGEMNVTLNAGKYYLIGASWDSSVTYIYTTDRHPSTVSFGETIAGYGSSTYPPPGTADGWWTDIYLYPQKLVLSENHVVRMDDSIDDSTYSTNMMDLALKLQGFTDVTLEFRHRDSNDETDTGDGIFLSVDNGANFTRIYGLGSSPNWQDISVDIDARAAENGLTLSDSTIIRFQQTDNYSWPTDGREFDDIKLYAKPDLILTGVYTDSSFLFKGFSNTKDIPISLSVESRAGNSTESKLIKSSFTFDYLGVVTLMSETNSTVINMSPLSVTSRSITHTLHLPATWHLTDINYNILGGTDTDGVMDEALENNNTNSKAILINHYSGILWFDDIETDITITNWATRVANSASLHWISGTGILNGEGFSFNHLDVVKDTSTLDYSIDPAENTVIDVAFPDRYQVSNVSYWHDDYIHLSTNGAYGTTKVLLPAGLSISTNEFYIMDSTVSFAEAKLSQDLYPAESIRVADNFKISEETKPLVFYTDWFSWNPTNGMFAFNKDYADYTRKDDLNGLEQEEANGNLLTPDMAIKKSNDTYYRNASQVITYPVVNTGSKGEALLNTKLVLESVEMYSHFPYDVYQAWADNSAIVIVDDLLSNTNELLSPSDFHVLYNPDCTGAECAGSNGMESIYFKPQTDTILSLNGGLKTGGSLPNNDVLHWGTRYDGSTAQQTSAFSEGAVYIAGHFIRGDMSALGATSQFGPAEILLSGMCTNDTSVLELPGTSEYKDGLADYAGLNLRTYHDNIFGGRAIIGGADTDWWGLTGRSKYYMRYSGVSGIHEAVPESFPPSLEIYKYPFTFSNYGLSYLSGKTEESRINGSVFLKDPCNITMDFERLMVCCLGELEDAELANSDTKTLQYWDAVIQPLTLFFAPTGESKCDNIDRKLCMGLTTHCANVDQTLSGVLGFLADGNLATPQTGIVNVPSRLSVPNQVELDGPGTELYYFTPTAMPYYNDYDISGDSSEDRGWINFAGSLDVAFFEDLNVHIHTSASTNSSLAPIYMMGGWKESTTNTFFNSDPDKFDTENAGYPYTDISYDDYRNSDNEDYLTHAQRSWLNVVNLDYPLSWSSSTKSFKSPETEKVDMLVIKVEHQTDYLSAENAEISFGVQYDGIPQINIANMAFNALDEATGMSSAFSDAVGSAVHDTIAQGVSAMDDILSDLPDKIFEPLFQDIVDPMVDNFYTALNSAYNNAPNTAYYGSVITQYINGVGSPVNDDIDYILKHLTTSTSMAVTLTENISNSLEQAISMIDAFTGIVSVDTDGNLLPDELPGILYISDGNYSTLAGLGKGILQVLAQSLYDSLQSSIEDEIKDVLQSAAPSLEAITETMTDLREILVEAQGQLAAVGSMATQLNTALNSTDLDSSINLISSDITSWFEDLPSGTDFGDYSADEVKAMIRQRIVDRFYSSSPCAEVQRIIRSRLYEVDASIQEAIDSVFQQLNKVLRDIASEYLSGIDDTINGALGDISDVMGAGQINGYAHIKDDTLSELRIDAKFQWKVPSEMDFNAYLIIKQLDSTAAGGCGAEGEEFPEVTIGTKGFGIGWLGCDIKADISAKFAFESNTNGLNLIGLGGAFEMVEGEIGFESFAITKLYAAVAFGALENYISANLKCSFTDYEVEGGAFFGKACSLDPFSWDPEVQSILGDPPFAGVYVYGEGWIPIINYGCFFQIRAGVGAGIFAFTDGRIGGKILMGADGEALCVVSVGGEVVLAGIKDGTDLRMNGTGTIKGKVGACPFCVKFSKTVKFTYNNGDWSVDY